MIKLFKFINRECEPYGKEWFIRFYIGCLIGSILGNIFANLVLIPLLK